MFKPTLVVLVLAVAYASAFKGDKSGSHERFDMPHRFSALDKCISKITDKSVDIFIDVAAPKAAPPAPKAPANAKPAGKLPPPPPRNHMVEDIAHFIDSVSRNVSKSVGVVIVYVNETKHYVDFTNMSHPVPNNKPTPKPKPGQKPVPAPHPSVGMVVAHALTNQAAQHQMPTVRPEGAFPTAFTIVITDAAHKTPADKYPQPNLIVDMGGNFTIANPTVRNQLLNTRGFFGLEDTIRLRVCQALGIAL